LKEEESDRNETEKTGNASFVNEEVTSFERSPVRESYQSDKYSTKATE
jgi:hypothetical protein